MVVILMEGYIEAGLNFSFLLSSLLSPPSMVVMEGSIKARLEDAKKFYQAQSQARFEITQEIMDKKMDRDNIALKLKYKYCCRHYEYRQCLGWRHNELQHLEDTLHNIHCLKNPIHGKANRPRSPMEDIDDHIASLSNRMQHGCHNLAKEKKLLKDIKQAEEDKQDLITNAAMKKKNVSEFLSSVEAVRDRIKQIYIEIEEVKLKDMSHWDRGKRRDLQKELEGFKRDINRLEKKLVVINMKKNAAYKLILELKEQRDDAVSL